jgi:hypothetical protein
MLQMTARTLAWTGFIAIAAFVLMIYERLTPRSVENLAQRHTPISRRLQRDAADRRLGTTSLTPAASPARMRCARRTSA